MSLGIDTIRVRGYVTHIYYVDGTQMQAAEPYTQAEVDELHRAYREMLCKKLDTEEDKMLEAGLLVTQTFENGETGTWRAARSPHPGKNSMQNLYDVIVANEHKQSSDIVRKWRMDDNTDIDVTLGDVKQMRLQAIQAGGLIVDARLNAKKMIRDGHIPEPVQYLVAPPSTYTPGPDPIATFNITQADMDLAGLVVKP